MRWRVALFAFLTCVLACTPFAQGFSTQVVIEVEPEFKSQVIKKVGQFGAIDSDQANRIVATIRPTASFESVKKTLSNAKGIRTFRIREPKLDFAALRASQGFDWNSVRPAYQKRYKEFLEVLEKEDRAKAKAKPPGLNSMDAWVYWMDRRGLLGSDIDVQALYRKAVEQASHIGTADGLTSGWKEVGPGSLDPPDDLTSFGPSPVTGRVNAIAYNPQDPSIIWLGTAGGGLWKSTDSGQNWSPQSDQWKSMNISSIAVHPENPSIVYVGTGDFNGWIFSSAGIYKTINNGSTWAQLGPTDGWASVNEIMIDLDNPNIVLAATGTDSQSAGVTYRSTSSGGAWTQVTTCYALTRLRGLFGGYTYLGSSNSGAIKRSVDQGETWTQVTIPNISPLGGSDIEASAVNINRAFFVAAGAEQVFETNDRGLTWTDITGNLSQAGVWPQASTYNLHLTATEATTTNGTVDVIYLGTRDLYRMVRPSTSWTSVGLMSGSAPRFHTDQHAMTIHPSNPNQALIGNDGGIYRITLNPTTLSTSVGALNNDIGILQFYGAAFSPIDKWEMLAGAQDNGTSFKNGRLDQPWVVTGGDGIWPIIKATATPTQLSGSQRLGEDGGQFRMRRTNDSWETKGYTAYGSGVEGEFPFIPIVIPDPTNADRVYACGIGVYRYSFNADDWTVRLGNHDFGAQIRAMAVAPTNGNRLYVAAGQKIFTSSNGGSSWVDMTIAAPLPANTYISSISVSPTSSTSIIVTSSDWHGINGADGILECSNVTIPAWVNRSGNLPAAPVNTLERHPEDPANRWFAGTDIGLFQTVDRGATWTSFGSDFPDVIVLDLHYVPGQKMIYATTFGRGIWRYGIDAEIDPVAVEGFGRLVTGNLSSLLTQDFSAFSVRPYQRDPLEPHLAKVGWTEIDFDSPVWDPSQLSVDFVLQQSNAHFRTSLHIYNFDFKRWESLWEQRGVLLYSSRSATKDGIESLENYISTLKKFRIRFKVEPSSFRAVDTSLLLDKVSVTVEP